MGNLLLDPATMIWLPPQTFSPTGYLTFDFVIPSDPALGGGAVYWQMLHVAGSSFRFGNRETLALQ
jgi:hypothetical protein